MKKLRSHGSQLSIPENDEDYRERYMSLHPRFSERSSDTASEGQQQFGSKILSIFFLLTKLTINICNTNI